MNKVLTPDEAVKLLDTEDSGVSPTFSALRAAIKFTDMYNATNPGRKFALRDSSTLRREDSVMALALLRARKWDSLSEDAKELSAQLMKRWRPTSTEQQLMASSNR